MARNKIGFLTSGAGGNPTGIGTYVHALHGEGIPAVVFCNDGTVGISDALATGGDHVLLYRIVKDGSESWSVPDYSLPPKEAAAKHWNKLKPQFHPDFVANKGKVWLQPINEVDKGRSDWLGNFAVEFATIANWEGYKVAMFAWSSGEPEPEHWRTAGMVNYLKYCAAHKEQAAVAVHEYDYLQVGMANTHPWHIGRFQELFKACDELGIKRPYVLISEFGWSYDSIPAISKCLEDVAFAAELYAKYPDVLGAVIWYLGPGFNNIANATQQLIAPVTNYTLNTEFPDTPGGPPMETWQQQAAKIADDTQALFYKAGASLQTTPTSHGFQVFGNEFDFTRPDGVKVRMRGAIHPTTAVRRYYWCPIPQWSNVSWYELGEVPPAPPPFEFKFYPVEGETLYVTSQFNAPRPQFPAWTNRLHEGIDLRAATGKRIASVEAGVVDGIRTVDPGDGYGIYVRVKHNDRYLTWYGHMQSIAVSVGQSVAAGQFLGISDNTGGSTGPHLHLTLQDLQAGLDGYIINKVVDPLPWLEKFTTPSPPPTYQYNGPAVTFSPALHAPGSDWEWAKPEVQGLYNLLKIPVKFMSDGTSSNYYQQFNRPQFHIVRVFWKATAAKTPLQAWEQDIRDGVMAFYQRGARKFELLNEPNLAQEGAGMVWTADTLGEWLKGLAQIIRAACPEARLYFPGMSPGTPWTDQFWWTSKAWPVVKSLCSGFALHAYTGIVDNQTAAVNDIVNQVKEAQAYLNLQVPLVVSECSVNRAASANYKAAVYKAIEGKLKVMPGVESVCWYISSWELSGPEAANQESWIANGIGAAYSAL